MMMQCSDSNCWFFCSDEMIIWFFVLETQTIRDLIATCHGAKVRIQCFCRLNQDVSFLFLDEIRFSCNLKKKILNICSQIIDVILVSIDLWRENYVQLKINSFFSVKIFGFRLRNLIFNFFDYFWKIVLIQIRFFFKWKEN